MSELEKKLEAGGAEGKNVPAFVAELLLDLERRIAALEAAKEPAPAPVSSAV